MTLGDALPEEMARVRDQVMPSHILVGDCGRMALMLMRRSLGKAERAMIEGDVAGMAAALQELRAF